PRRPVRSPPPGASSAPRCRRPEARCREIAPALEARGAEHVVACLRAEETGAHLRSAARISVDRAAPGPGAVAAAADAAAARPVGLEVRGLSKHFPVTRGAILGRLAGTVKAGDGGRFPVGAREAHRP